MIEPSLKAIVIGAIPYSDSSKVVKVLTKEHGVLPLFVRLKKKGWEFSLASYVSCRIIRSKTKDLYIPSDI